MYVCIWAHRCMYTHMQVYAQTDTCFLWFQDSVMTSKPNHTSAFFFFSSQLPPAGSTACFPCQGTLPDIALLKKQGYTFCLHRHVLLTVFWSDLFLVVKLRHVQGMTITFFPTCPVGQVDEFSTCLSGKTSCPSQILKISHFD